MYMYQEKGARGRSDDWLGVRGMVVNAIFNNISGISFYWWRKPEYREKTTVLTEVTDELYHIMLYQI